MADEAADTKLPFVLFYLDASTAHLTKKTRALLTKMAGDPQADWTVASTGYGWFVNCPDQPETFNPPMDLLAVWRFAALHGCQGVLFDADATIIPDRHPIRAANKLTETERRRIIAAMKEEATLDFIDDVGREPLDDKELNTWCRARLRDRGIDVDDNARSRGFFDPMSAPGLPG